MARAALAFSSPPHHLQADRALPLSDRMLQISDRILLISGWKLQISGGWKAAVGEAERRSDLYQPPQFPSPHCASQIPDSGVQIPSPGFRVPDP